MAIFSASLRNVRRGVLAGAVPQGASTVSNPVPAIHSHVSTAYTSTSALTDADALLLAKSILAKLNSARSLSALETPLKDALKLAHASNTARTTVTTGVYSFRHGKAVYQFGVGYHATVPNTAYTSTTWHNISA
jgi:hypothetical protein